MDRILLAHNFYRQRAGEDGVFFAERELLRTHGHTLIEFTQDNRSLVGASRLGLAAQTIWSRRAHTRIQEIIQTARPNLAHFHNTFPLLSPSVYSACREAGVPVVQTLHNYRLLCPAATLFRDGHVCEDCLKTWLPWPGVVHACYRRSRTVTGVVAGMLAVHRALGTWRHEVDVYVALSEFARRKFLEAGLPEAKITVKPNFVARDPGLRDMCGRYAIVVGRLSVEKGLRTLLSAWKCRGLRFPLRIFGDGPLRNELEREKACLGLANVSLEGCVERDDTWTALKSARFMVFPSECYENFPLAIVEAFACGVPVVASRLGAMQEIVENGRTGLHFNPGDSEDLAAKADWAWSHPQEMEAMGREARTEYENKYTANRNYQMLMDIYGKAIQRHNSI